MNISESKGFVFLLSALPEFHAHCHVHMQVHVRTMAYVHVRRPHSKSEEGRFWGETGIVGCNIARNR